MKGLEVSEEQVQHRQKSDYLLCAWTSALMIVGYIKAFFSGFPSIEEFWWIYAAAGAGGTLLFMLLFQIKYRKWVLLTGLTGVLVIVLFDVEKFVNGVCILANDFLEYLTGVTGSVYLDFPVTGTERKYLVPVLFVGVLTLLICWFVYHRWFIPCFIFAALGVLGCVGGFLKADYGLILLAAGMLMFAVTAYYRVSGAKSFLLLAAGLTTVIAVSVIPALIVCAELDYDVSFEQETRQIQYAAHKEKYDSGMDAMPEGNLVNVGSFDKNGEAALFLEAETPQKFYLRGMTGEVYTGSSWEGFDADTYQKGEELFYWLHKLDFYVQISLAEAGSLLSEPEPEKNLKITNVSACRGHAYLPYAMADTAVLTDTLIGDDRTLEADGSIELKFIPGSVPQWYQTAVWLSENQSDQKVQEYLLKEESYRKFVYDNNLQLTNTVVGVFERIFGEEANKEKALSEVLELVRTTLDEKLTYEENIVTYNGKNDFVRYTLEQSKEGYSVHYASAATLMLRYMGVPARYVEGYFLSADEAAQYRAGEKITITEGHAHAWTEYYMDGVGWIPFEVTPGYIDDEEWNEVSMVIADGKGEGEGKAFTQSQLTYTPPKYPEQDTNLPDLNSLFRFQTKHVLWFLLVILLLAALAGLLWVARNCIRLKRFFKRIKGAKNREAVTELFGYAQMLVKKCGACPRKDWKPIQVNEKARFSEHEITDEERMCVEQYAQAVRNNCKDQNSVWKKLKDRYILWRY